MATDGERDRTARLVISSASWIPVAEAPTTSTPPSGSCDGLRYSRGVTWSTPEIREANGGTNGRSLYPVAITTFRATHSPRLVATR